MHYKRRSRRSDSNFDMGWDKTTRERKLPVGDAPSNGKSRSKRVRPKKERCPVAGTHVWYREIVTLSREVVTGYRWVADLKTCVPSYEMEQADYRQATCIECWKVKRKPVEKHILYWKRYRSEHYKPRLPRRKVKLY